MQQRNTKNEELNSFNAEDEIAAAIAFCVGYQSPPS